MYIKIGVLHGPFGFPHPLETWEYNLLVYLSGAVNIEFSTLNRATHD